jgi:L,D-transpeptidase ErfK/SrfK
MSARRFTVEFTAVLVACLAATAAQSAEYEFDPHSDVIGTLQKITAAHEDTFVSLARRFNVGFEELRQANPGVDPWLPGEGTEITIPSAHVLPRAERRGIVINIPEYRLYYFPEGGGTVITHPISIGRQDWRTPLGPASVVNKAIKPTWYPPQSIREEHAARNDPLPAAVPPGPDNPLGEHAIYLSIPGYLVHGTNKPAGIGMRVTHGCIRMYPEDIEALFNAVDEGTPVRIVNQPYKLGWGKDGLYFEAHLPLTEEVERGEWSPTAFTREYVAVTDEGGADVRWDVAEEIMRDARGVPGFVSVERMARQRSDVSTEDSVAGGTF